jgi:hypothetical protein
MDLGFGRTSVRPFFVLRGNMREFTTAEEAKQFFIEKVVEQTEREGVRLSDVERKMLRWTEVYPILGLPPAKLKKINEEFEQQYDSSEYESKIADLMSRAYARDLGDGLGENWKGAYAVLSKQDHYILVMLEQALGSKLKRKRFFGLF